MWNFKRVLFLVILSISITVVCAQDNPRGDIPDEIVYKGDRFKINSKWVSAYFGFNTPFNNPGAFNTNFLGLDFHIPQHKDEDKYNFYNFGVISYGKETIFRSYNFHATYGKRYVTKKTNLAFSGGLSATTGYLPTSTIDSVMFSRSAGLYADFEYVYKLVYDVGIGGKVFASYDFAYPMYGIGINLYFSSSYKGKSRNLYDTQ